MASIHLDEAHDTCNSNVSNPPQGGTAKSASERLAIDPFNAKLIKFPSDLLGVSASKGPSPAVLGHSSLRKEYQTADWTPALALESVVREIREYEGFLSGVRLAGKSPGQRLCVLTE